MTLTAQDRPAMTAEGGPKVRGFAAGTGRINIADNKMAADLSGAIIGDVALKRTIDAASTLEFSLDDSTGRLRKHPLFQVASMIELEGLRFRIVQIAKRGPDLSLIAEEELAYLLRQKRGPKKAFRDKMTRAEFCLSVAREVQKDVPYWSPQLTKAQPIESAKQARAQKRQQPGRGIARGAKLTVKGQPADPEQIRNGERVLAVGVSLGAPRAALISVIVTGIQEQVMRNRPGGHGTSNGFFQVIDSTAASLGVDPLDLEACANIYFTKGFYRYGGAIKNANEGYNPAEISSRVEGNAAGPSDRVRWIEEATAWVDAYGGSGLSAGDSRPGTGTKRYAFAVERDETYWDALKRLMEEVNWRRFVNAGRLYLATDNDLLSLRPGVIVGSDAPGIDNIDWEVDGRKRAQEATLSGRASTWSVPPGTPVILDESHGPAEGKWLVHSIDGFVNKDDINVTLKRRSKPLPEPAPETRSTSSGGGRKRVPASAGQLSQVTISSTAAGSPHWGGSAAVIDQFVIPFMQRQGLSAGSRDRDPSHPESIKNPGSDHNTANTTSQAVDFPTGSGESAARALAVAMGNPGWRPSSYDGFTIQAGGHSFRVQILWGSGVSHTDHIHVGVRQGG